MNLIHTDDGDKDADTHVTVEVRDEGGTIAARIDDDFGLFTDQSDNGPFDLELMNKSTKSSLRSGTVEIRVDPKGNDVWKFNYFLDLMFDDRRWEDALSSARRPRGLRYLVPWLQRWFDTFDDVSHAASALQALPPRVDCPLKGRDRSRRYQSLPG